MTDTKNSNPAGAQDLNEKVKATAASATDEAKARAKDVADTVASDAARYADEAKGAAATPEDFNAAAPIGRFHGIEHQSVH